MINRRWVAVTIVLSLVLGMLPRPGWAAETEAARTPQAVSLRASVDAAAARLAGEAPQAVREATSRHASSGGGQFGGGGGGGKGMMITTIVLTVVGVGASYYMLKQLQKQTDQAKQQQ